MRRAAFKLPTRINALSTFSLRRYKKYCFNLSLCLIIILVIEEGSDAFSVTPSSSSSSRRHRHRHRSVHPPNKGSPSFGRLEFSYKRVKADSPNDLRAMNPDDVAESLETILKEQREDACEQAFIGSLDAWMVASNKAKKDEPNDRIVRYGKRMEDVLTLMEANCASGTTIDAYGTVIHLYVGGKESYAALRVLRRMENQLLAQQQQSSTNGGGEFQNFKLRRIQYNRVLQGLVSTSEDNPLHLETAFQLLMSMALQEDFLHPPAGFKEPFSPTSIEPDAKSFAMVLVAMLTQEGNVKDDELVTLIDQARKLGQLNDFLLKKIERAMTSSGNNKERFDIIKQRINLPS